MKRTIFPKVKPLAVAITITIPALAVTSAAHAEFTGNIGVFSKYVLRGITNSPENDSAAIQGGLDWAHESGFYLGWWASSLGYSYDASTATVDGDGSGVENDFYGGFANAIGNFYYDVGLIQYYYIDVDDSNLTEFKAAIGYGPVSGQMQYLLNDGWWGNQGDIYWTLNFAYPLPMNFNFAATLGYYTYEDDDNDELCNPAPAGCGITTTTSEFRHLDLTLSHPIGNTGADMNVTYIVGGKNRAEVDQDDTLVLSLTYGFDI